MKKRFTTRSMCLAAIIAGLYAALTLALPALSYGQLQCRLSEALTLLPMALPQAIPGLFVGCLVANLLSPVGALDVIFGSLATLLAALGTYRFRTKPLLAAACPILSNGLIIGWLLSYSYGLPFWLTAAEVALGEAVAVAAGMVLMQALKRVDLSRYN